MAVLVKFGLPSCAPRFRIGLLALVGILFALAVGSDVSLSAAIAPESNVKAAFLYKFLSYVEWSPETFQAPPEPIVIGVLENEAVAAALSEIAAENTVGERPVIVKPMRRGASMGGLHVLFIGHAADKRLEQLISIAESKSIMTVTEADAERESAAVINFLLIDGRVRFAASVPAANRAGVRLSSRLLGVAETVEMESR